MKYEYLKNIKNGAFSKCSLHSYRSKYYAIKKNIESVSELDTNDVREIYSSVKLKSHPNIAILVDLHFDKRNILNLVYDYYPIRLDEFIRSNNPFKRSELFISFASQLLSAVHYIHLHDIIHTDIKPENILIIPHNNNIQIKIIDFGSSNINFFTYKDPIISTYLIRAPELYNMNGDYNNKIDIWSAGVVMYNYIYDKDIIRINPKLEEFDKKKLNQIIDFYNNIDLHIKDKNLYLLLCNMIEIDKSKRYNIYEVISLFNEIYKTTIYLYRPFVRKRYSTCLDLDNLNIFICSRSNIKINNLDFGLEILSYCYFQTKDINILTSWYINYLLHYQHPEDRFSLKSLIPFFNSYFSKIFYLKDIEYKYKRLLKKLI
tara:strand:- start:556 stop:1677 length:1122 start_codon:yes stop_codon:yes gene_type:complete